jgi:hypothetical protein
MVKNMDLGVVADARFHVILGGISFAFTILLRKLPLDEQWPQHL